MSDETKQEDTCPRQCTGCDGYHHWIEAEPEDFGLGHPAVLEHEVIFACKHCDAWRPGDDVDEAPLPVWAEDVPDDDALVRCNACGDICDEVGPTCPSCFNDGSKGKPNVEVEFSERTHKPGDKEAGTMRGEIRGYCPTIREEEEHQRRNIPYRLEAIERKLDGVARAVAAVTSKYTDAESRKYDETAASEGETDYIRELRTGLECMIADGKLDSAIESGREICASWTDDHKRLHAVIAELDKLASEDAPDVVANFGAHLCRVISAADEEKL